MSYLKDIIIVDSSTLTGNDIGLFLDLGEYYSFDFDGSVYTFQVSDKTTRSQVQITWEGTTPVNFPVSVSSFRRGFGSSTSVYSLNFLRRGFLDIDNIVFDLFFKKICKWTWTRSSDDTQWEENQNQNVDFFFFNKRPITRQPYVERTLGAQDNVDYEYSNSQKKTNVGNVTTPPFISFQPLGEVMMDDVMVRVEEFYATLDSLPPGVLATEYTDIETFQPPQIYEFNYQLTCVTDSWKDCRILNNHVQNSIIPRINGERFITFPSGFTHSVRIESSEIVGDESTGMFETSTTFTFLLPLIEQLPQLTWSWLTGQIELDEDETVSVT